jgi:hypothetical protein
MSYLYFIKNVINDTDIDNDNDTDIDNDNGKNEFKLKYYFVEIKVDDKGLLYSNPFRQNIKDEYVFYDYNLKISKPFYSNINDKIQNIENQLDKDKYYLCIENDIFGFKNPDKIFIKIIPDYDSNRDIIQKIKYDIKNKIITLLHDENILNTTN